MKIILLKYFPIVLLAFLFSEITLRIIKPASLELYRIQKSYHKLDPEYFVDLEPNIKVRVKHFMNFYDIQFSTNELGFRGTDKINNSMPQIGCIGDSVTMGFGVNDEETFCYKLNNFQDSKNLVYQSVNLGTDAYGPTAISLKLKKYLPQLNLKLLFYFPSTGDDIDERVFEERKTKKLSRFLFTSQFILTKYSYLALALKISQEQLVYRTLESLVWPVQKLSRTIKCKSGRLPTDECKDIFLSNGKIDIVSEFLISRPPPKDEPPIFPESECTSRVKEFIIPEKMMKSVEEIITQTEERKIKLVMILAPIDIETAYCSQKGKLHRYYEYLTTLKKILRKKKIDFIDLNEKTNLMIDSKGRMNPRPFYIVGDGHYTKSGNDWIAKILSEKAKEVLK
ncbi:MAG: hypothetical protein L6Q54_15065 [Leptospiraceae bacterium]|nr:hypothetical protein [Leptospiraceae bacterium]MCK6382554.1 hypothetical protein [Leptospiraceae bacterium]NUM42172.1 hypothetical protein [Leptospiraceae bacterium]